MLLYVDEVLREIAATAEYARIVRQKFEQGRPAEELLLDAKALHARAVSLDAMMPENAIRVAESGIRVRADVERLRAAGFHAFLVGESLLRQDDRTAAVQALV